MLVVRAGTCRPAVPRLLSLGRTSRRQLLRPCGPLSFSHTSTGDWASGSQRDRKQNTQLQLTICRRPFSASSILSHSAGEPEFAEVSKGEGKAISPAGSVSQPQKKESVPTVRASEIPVDNNDNLTAEPAPVEERWRPLKPASLRELPGLYMELTKMRLSGLVILTTMVGYAVAPGVVSPDALLWTSVGTGMCVSSANCINQWLEAPFDGQMSRTRNRVLVRVALAGWGSIQPIADEVRQALSPPHALAFGLTIGAVGTGLLCVQVNSLVAALGFANILLYTCVYTPSKRMTILNTWYGAVVGAIPPMMGWAACTGGLEDGAWVLAGLLYAWQFPHFNSLSWNLRQDYSKAGYRMMAVTDPGLCKRVALRYAALMFPLCFLCPYLDITTWNFAYTSSAVNAFMLYGSWRFYQDANAKTARGLFFASIVHLPLLLSLLLIHKKTRKPKELKDETDREFLLDSTVAEPPPAHAPAAA